MNEQRPQGGAIVSGTDPPQDRRLGEKDTIGHILILSQLSFPQGQTTI